jgi:RHH-type transcriptional regulator, rel operon repressor / antitoxin RelB
MDKQTISFRLDADKVEALDEVAKSLDRDRTYVLNEAVRNYLEVQQWQVEHIKEGLRQAERGELIDNAEVKRIVKTWRRRS